MLYWFFLLPAQENTVSEWKLEKDKDDIQIYTRKVTDFKLKEFKAVTSVNASVELLFSILHNAEKYSEWMSNLQQSHILKQTNENELYIYSESNLPWPFSNRDIVSQSLFYHKDGKSFMKITGLPDYIPEKKGIIRMKYTKGLWTFIPLASGETKIIYQFLGDPGGSIPGWLANLFIVDGPYKTLLHLKEVSEKYVQNK